MSRRALIRYVGFDRYERRLIARHWPRNDRSYLGLVDYGQKQGWSLRQIAEYYGLDLEYVRLIVSNSLQREPK